jgi:hypothetical protein
MLTNRTLPARSRRAGRRGRRTILGEINSVLEFLSLQSINSASSQPRRPSRLIQRYTFALDRFVQIAPVSNSSQCVYTRAIAEVQTAIPLHPYPYLS